MTLLPFKIDEGRVYFCRQSVPCPTPMLIHGSLVTTCLLLFVARMLVAVGPVVLRRVEAPPQTWAPGVVMYL